MGIEYEARWYTNPEVDPACGPLATQVGQRTLLKAVDWALQHAEPVDERIWEQVYRVSQHAKSPRTRLMACRIFADRFDPAPRPPAVEVSTGPVTITWRSSSPTNRAPSSSGSTTPSTGIALGPPASSATDVLANL